MEDSKEVLTIDIENVLKSKSEKLAKRVPRFVINYLKRIIHQDEINELLLKNKDYEGVDFATHILEDLNVSFRVHSHFVPESGKKYIFVSNHPLGGLDGMILISYLGSQFGDIRFMVNDLLMFIKPLAPVFVPINKFGKMRHDNSDTFLRTFASDKQILYFPAGLCSRLIKGEVTDLEWKKTFVTKSLEFGRDIVPMHFSGENSKFFYRLANVRKKLGIKFNVEMIYLPNEMFKQKNTTFDLYIGDPIPYTSLTKEHSHKEWCQIIREKSYETRNQTD